MIIHPFIPSQQIHPPKSSVDPRGPSFQHPTVFLAPLFAEGWAVRTFEVRKAMGKAENAQKMAEKSHRPNISILHPKFMSENIHHIIQNECTVSSTEPKDSTGGLFRERNIYRDP